MSKKKTTGFVAAAAGIALLMGGATFALWNDSADAGGGTITTGNLEVDVLNPTWADVSEDREDERDIDLGNYRIVPGDTIRGKFPIDVALEGDNLAAKLSFYAGVNRELHDALVNGPIDVQFHVVSNPGPEEQVVVEPGIDTSVTVDLAAKDGNVTDNRIAVGARLDEQADLAAVVELTFDENTSPQELTQTQLALTDAGVKLEQAR